jgi:hypothetical protein
LAAVETVKQALLFEKGAKTFATAPTARRTLDHPCAAPVEKVFWFFFSKKNRLPALLKTDASS